MKHDNQETLEKQPRFVKIGEAAKFLGLNPGTVRAAVRRGDLPGVRVGAQFLVRRDALEQMAGVGAL